MIRSRSKVTVNEAKLKQLKNVVDNVRVIANVCDSICSLEKQVARLLTEQK